MGGPITHYVRTLCIGESTRISTFLSVAKAEAEALTTAKNVKLRGFIRLKTHPIIMRAPHNQQLGNTCLIIAPYAYHDNWSLLDQHYLSIPGLECCGRTKKIIKWCVWKFVRVTIDTNEAYL